MKSSVKIILWGVIVAVYGFQAKAKGDLDWLQGARLAIQGGPCAGTFTLAAEEKPETTARGGLTDLHYPLAGPAGCQPPELVITRQGSNFFAVAVEYHAEEPVAPTAGFVLYLKAPPAVKVHASYVPSKVTYMWTEPFWTNSLGKLPRETNYALWQGPRGGFGAAIPLVGGGHRTVLQSEGGEITAVASSSDPGYVPARVPLLAWGHGPDPYQLTSGLYAFALPAMGALGKPRAEKAFPEIFNYLGWCSWNTYYRNINEDKLVAHAKHFQEAKLPFRWMLIDDGWQTLDKRCSTFRPCVMHLTSFEAAPDRFPGGLKQTTQKIKSYGISWVAVWHTFEGYWNGIAVNSDLGRNYTDALLPVPDQGAWTVTGNSAAPQKTEIAAVPDPRSDKGQKFWDDFYAFLKDSGIDFVKVDNQCGFGRMVQGKVPIAEAVAGAQKNFQEAAAKYFNSAVINCMSMNVESLYNWYLTNDARNSIDYVPLFPNNPRAHIFKNTYNALWYSELTWPDWDMWKTHDQAAVMHAVGRAISGGPVYVTDDLGRERKELLMPLVFSDGRVLRVDAPALPTRDVLFIDPRFAPAPLKAFARVGNTGVVAAWNVNFLNLPVGGAVSPADCEGLKGERFAVYEHFSGKLITLSASGKSKISLRPFGVRLYVLAPIRNGFAAIGLVDKYISHRAITNELWTISTEIPGFAGPGSGKDTSPPSKELNGVTIDLVEGGRFAAFAEKAPKEVTVNGAKLSSDKISYQEPKLVLDLTNLGKGPLKVILSW